MFSAREAILVVNNKVIGTLTGSVDVHQQGSIDLVLRVADELDVPQVTTHTALNWSDPAVYNNQTHLSMHSKTHIFSIVDWDTDLTVNFANKHYSVYAVDRDTDGQSIYVVDASGIVLQDASLT